MSAGLFTLAGATGALVLFGLLLRGRQTFFWMAFLAALIPIGYLDRYHVDLPDAARWMPFGLVALSALGAAVLLPDVRARIPGSSLLVYAGLLVAGVLSMLLNGSSVAALLYAQRIWVLVFCAIVALKSAYGVYTKDELCAFLVRAGMVSAVLCVLQRIFVVPRIDHIDRADRVTGLFEVGYIALFFHLVCIGIVLSYWLQGRRVVRRSPALVLLVLTVALAVGNQKAALPYFLLVVGFAFLRAGRRALVEHGGKLLIASLALPAFVLGVFGFLYDAEREGTRELAFHESIADRGYVERYLFGTGDTEVTSGGDLRRGAAIRRAHERISVDTAHLALGMGPGSTSESRAGRLAREHPGIGRVALSRILGEEGCLGLVLSLAFLLTVARGPIRGPVRGPGARREAPEHRNVRHLFVALTVAYLIYGDIHNEPVYALLVACLLFPGSGEHGVRHGAPGPRPS